MKKILALPVMNENKLMPHRRGALTLAALGVVYGDIGTSPLYAIKETFNASHGIPLTLQTILGGISVIF